MIWAVQQTSTGSDLSKFDLSVFAALWAIVTVTLAMWLTSLWFFYRHHTEKLRKSFDITAGLFWTGVVYMVVLFICMLAATS